MQKTLSPKKLSNPILPKPILWRLLLPFSILLFLIIASASQVIYLQHQTRLKDQLGMMSDRVADAFRAEVADLAESLQFALIPIASNYHVKQFIELGDKESLYKTWQPIYEMLNVEYGINHFTFMDKYRSRILRVHLPKQSEGIVNRHTILEAQRTECVAWGIELEMGSLEIPTLRVVQPVFRDSTIVGYVELGEDIDGLLREIHERTNVHLIATVFKENIDQERWAKTMKILSRAADWDKLIDEAVFYTSLDELPSTLIAVLNSKGLESINNGLRISFNDKIWQVSKISITDATENAVGHIIFMVDSTSIVESFTKTTIIGVLIISILLVTLLSLMYFILNRTDKFIIFQYGAIVESERNYKLLFNSVADSIVIYDLEGNFIDYNENAYQLYGYSRSELKNIKPQDIVHPDLHNILWDNQQRIRAGETTLVESVHLRKNGTSFPVEIKSLKIEMGGTPVVISVIRDTSERKKNQQLIQQQSDQLKALKRTTTEGLWIIGMDGKLKAVNKAYCQMSGYTEDELLKFSISSLEARENAQEIEIHTQKIIKQGWDIFESVHRRKDGSIYNVMVSVSFDRERKELYGYIRDITDEKKAKDLLHRLNNRFSIAESAGNLGVWEWNIKSNEVFWSDNLYKIFGYKPNEVSPSKSLFDQHIHAEDAENVDRTLSQAVLQVSKKFTLDFRIVNTNGETRWLSNQAIVLVDNNGIPDKTIGVCQDVTDRLKLEQELLLKENAIQNSITGIALSGTDGLITYVNNAFVKLWGYETDQDVIGRSVFEFWQNPDDIVEITESMKASNSWIGERDARRKDGSIFHCQISANFLSDVSGNVTHFMGSFWDSTQRNEYELKITNALKEKEFLLQEIHHRVKNNLQIISSLIYLQSLQIKDKEVAEIFTQNLSRIRSMALVHDFLYQSENLKSIDFEGYVEQLISNAREVLNNKQLQVNFQIVSKEVIHLEQAIYIGILIIELLNNSIKYAFVGNSKGNIQIGLEKEKGNYVLSFSDDGIGIPNIESLMEGKTFGVLMIKTLAKQLNGDIYYKSENGFHFSLIFPENKKNE
jgi:PAS domain S-box-containing protein